MLRACVVGCAIMLQSEPAPASEPEPTGATYEEAPPPAMNAQQIVLLAGRGREGKAMAAAAEGLGALLDAERMQVNLVAREIPQTEGAADALARSILAEHDAIAVLWLRPSKPGEITLRAVRIDDENLYGRTIEEPSSQLAAAETVAVIMADVADAATRDEPLGLRRIVVLPPTVTLDEGRVLPVGPAGHGDLYLGYAGSSYAPGVPWQSGVGLSVGWTFGFGLSVGAGYAFMAPVSVVRDAATIDITRHPLEFRLGYERSVGQRVRLGAEVPVLFDVTTRRTSDTDEDTVASEDAVRLGLGLGLRARVSVRLVWRLSLFAAGGLETYPRRVSFRASTPTQEVLLQTARVRGVARAGVALTF